MDKVWVHWVIRLPNIIPHILLLGLQWWTKAGTSAPILTKLYSQAGEPDLKSKLTMNKSKMTTGQV